MAQNRIIKIGPIALTNVLTTNILNCAVTSMAGPTGITIPQPYLLIKRVRIVNSTAGAVTFSLGIGGTGLTPGSANAFLGIGQSVAANSYFEAFMQKRLESTDFLVGGASAATSLTIEMDAEVGIA